MTSQSSKTKRGSLRPGLEEVSMRRGNKENCTEKSRRKLIYGSIGNSGSGSTEPEKRDEESGKPRRDSRHLNLKAETMSVQETSPCRPITLPNR